MSRLDAEGLYLHSVRPVLRSMGWGAGFDGFKEERIARGSNGVVYRYDHPAVRPFVVGVLAAEIGAESERWIGNIGYNVGAPLALLTAPERSRLLAPHMIAEGGQSSLRPGFDLATVVSLPDHGHIGADPLVLRDVPADPEMAVLRVAANPEEVAEAAQTGGRFTRRGFRFRVPVDESLMLHLIRIRERLIREESLNGAAWSEYFELDGKFLRLVGTLLFIRILEDNGDFTPSRTLWQIAAQDDLSDSLAVLVGEVGTRFGPAAVPFDAYRWKSETTVRDLIRGLYYDEAQVAPLDFRLLDEDILAQLYQEYLQYLLTDRRKTQQLRLLESEGRIPLRVRRTLGIYYTPRSVVEILCDQVSRHWNRPEMPRVLEPACGAAAFLRPLAGWLAGRWQDANCQALAGNVVGLDIDPRAVALARQTLARTFAQLKGKVPDLEVHQGDFLAEAEPGIPAFQGVSAAESFDIVVGNPPFLSHRALKRVLPESAGLYRQRFPGAVGGETNLSAYFIEQALRVLRPGGLLAFVVPRRLLRGSNATIRRTMLEQAELLSVVDLGLKSVFRGTDETTALLVLRKRERRVIEPGLSRAPAVFAMHYRDDQAALISRALVGQARSSEMEGTIFAGRCHASTEGPWLLLTPAGERTRQALTEGRTPLRDLVVSSYAVDMMSGDGQTLLFDRVSPGRGVVATRSRYLERVVPVERALLRDAVEAESLERFRSAARADEVSIFHPFGEDGVAVPEVEILDPAGHYPAAAALLRELEPVLRSVRGARKVPQWYAPAASRVRAPWHSLANRERYAETMLLAHRFSAVPKVATAPTTLVPVGSLFALFIRRPFGDHLQRLLIFLNSSLVNWYAMIAAPAFSRAGLPDRSKVTFADFNLPDSFLEADVAPVADALASLQNGAPVLTVAQTLRAEHVLDDWVYDSFGIDESLREHIREEVGHFTGNALYRSARARAVAHSSPDDLISWYSGLQRRIA